MKVWEFEPLLHPPIISKKDRDSAAFMNCQTTECFTFLRALHLVQMLQAWDFAIFSFLSASCASNGGQVQRPLWRRALFFEACCIKSAETCGSHGDITALYQEGCLVIPSHNIIWVIASCRGSRQVWEEKSNEQLSLERKRRLKFISCCWSCQLSWEQEGGLFGIYSGGERPCCLQSEMRSSSACNASYVL